MDDPTSHLTAQFGHSSQELINLLLTGQATSNTFDNTHTLGGSLKCHGIQSQATIGYLSQLEALRYCSVGSYYKTPKFPIWIIGSTSHFTVMFGPRESLDESASDILLERCRRAFKSIEGAEDNGFIPVNELENILKKLDLDLGAGVYTLGAALEMLGSGIILWSEFWKATSRLLTGASLESVLQPNDATHPSSTISVDAPIMLTQYGENVVDGGSNMETDEDLAKRLAAEWGAEQSWGGLHNPNDKSDEELARELQAQFESDETGEDVEIVEPTQSNETAMHIVESASRPQNVQSENDRRSVEKYKDGSFPMHHYNSLRGGALTTFQVTRLSSEEAVGMTVALSPTNVDSGSATNRGDGNDLEAVVRTKYTSCRFDWGGKSPPSLH